MPRNMASFPKAIFGYAIPYVSPKKNFKGKIV